MQVKVEKQEKGEVELHITLEPESVQAEIEKVFRQAAREVEVPGFRPGRAPRAMLEARLNQDAVRQEALERLTQTHYLKALDETGLEPIDHARVADEKLEEDGSFTFRATVAVMPEAKLGEYRGLKTEKPSTDVSDQAVSQEIERLRNRFLRFESQAETPIQEGDIAIINYVIEANGKKLEDSEVSDYPLEVGSDTLFPELNQGLLGAKSGETLRIQSKLPASYPDEAAAGKEATFDITVKDVRRRTLPELNDDFARSVAAVDSFDELRAKIREALEGIARHAAEHTVQDRLIEQVVEASEVEVPQVMLDRFVESRENEVVNELQKQGLTLESALHAQEQRYEDWIKDLQNEGRRTLKRHLVLRTIEKTENIEVDDEEIDAEIEQLAKTNRIPEKVGRKQLEASGALENIINSLKREKAINLLVENAEIVPEPEQSQDTGQTDSPEHGKE